MTESKAPENKAKAAEPKAAEGKLPNKVKVKNTGLSPYSSSLGKFIDPDETGFVTKAEYSCHRTLELAK